MSGTGVLIDSVIIIDHLNAIADATAYLRAVQNRAHVSPVTWAEVLVGYPDDQRDEPRLLLEAFEPLTIDPKIADLAADLRRRLGWKLPDAFQAALAKHHGLRLATRNTKDFDPDKHDFVTIPYRL